MVAFLAITAAAVALYDDDLGDIGLLGQPWWQWSRLVGGRSVGTKRVFVHHQDISELVGYTSGSPLASITGRVACCGGCCRSTHSGVVWWDKSVP